MPTPATLSLRSNFRRQTLSLAIARLAIAPIAVFSLAAAAFACLTLLPAQSALAQGFAPGFHVFSPPQGNIWGDAFISDDGLTVGGNVYNQNANPSTTSYTLNSSGITQFSQSPFAYDVSDNAAYTVGYASRRSASGVVDIFSPTIIRPEFSSNGAHISGNGQVVAGSSESANAGGIVASRAHRWTPQGGLQFLPEYRPNSALTTVKNISRDGNTIVGEGRDSVFGLRQEAWSWNPTTGFRILPDAPGAGTIRAEAFAVNFDGSIVVGRGNNSVGFSRAVKWQNGVPTVLTTPLNYRSCVANGLSDDGTIVTGVLAGSLTGFPETGAIWTVQTNWLPTLDYLRLQGLSIPAYYSSRFNTTISADGNTISSLIRDNRNGSEFLMVAVIPAPSSLFLLTFGFALSRRARARR